MSELNEIDNKVATSPLAEQIAGQQRIDEERATGVKTTILGDYEGETPTNTEANISTKDKDKSNVVGTLLKYVQSLTRR